VCVVGTGGVGKTSLIQVGLLLERLSGRDVYALLKEYSYKYTRAGYSPAKEKFKWSTFSGKLTLMDVLELVFAEDVRLKSIRKMDRDEQISLLISELDRENSILFVDDLQDADEGVKQAVFASGNNLTKGAVVAGTREKGNCYSAVGPLTGLHGTDLQDMIDVLKETQPEMKVDLALWSSEIFRITQGHPMLVDIMVKNAPHFSDVEKLKEIKGVQKVTDQKTVNEVMERLIRNILTEEELKTIGILSVFPVPVDKKFVDIIGGEEKVNGIIDKWLLWWDKGRLVFTFDAVRQLLETEAPKEYHEIAVGYYVEEVKEMDEFEKPGKFVEIIYHLLKAGKVEQASELYFDIGGYLERVRRRAVVVSEMLLGKTEEKNKRAIVLGTLGNLLSKGREFSGAESSYTRALKIRRKLAEKDPSAYESDVATTLNNLGALYSDLRDFEKAEQSYIEALKIYRKLAEKDPSAYESYVATTLNNLGNLYSYLRDFEKAEQSYIEALKIRRKLAEKDPSAYESYVATTLNNLGNLYSDLRDFEKAEQSYIEALKHKDTLPDNGARIYLGLAALAEEMKKENACQLYFAAGVISFNIYILYKLPSINFTHSFQKTQELSPRDSSLYKMATIALATLSKIENPQQPTNNLDNLDIDDLPEICKALKILITKGESTRVEEPKNDIELMFHFLYQILKSQFQ